MTSWIGNFLVGYPLTLALFILLLALRFSAAAERRERRLLTPPEGHLPKPPVSVLIPCFNEGDNLAETLSAALQLDWPDWEVIAINDGSSDDTGAQLDAWALRHPRLRVVQLASNQGKALALCAGALLARHEWLVCIDGDALLDPQAVAWMLRHLQRRPRLAAVTGNPRIRNRTTWIGRLQVIEFGMIIGLIKRAQSQLGGLFCVSGVIATFRRCALHEVGYWNSERLTEDIDLTWRLQRAGWEVIYEPHALVWILMPETLVGLWRQRLRWAEGGVEVLRANLDLLLRPRQWRLLPFLLEPLLSLVWAWTLALTSLAALLLAAWSGAHPVNQWLPIHLRELQLQGPLLLLLTLGILQGLVGILLDRAYDRGLLRNGFWLIWYPLAFWLVSFAASLVAVPRLMLRSRPRRARWVSPDRGVRA
jgi:biofilm PGA synthesis N-glycosyltransferase PgaC